MHGESPRRALIIFIGGGIGASLRELLLNWATALGNIVPILIANVLGSFVLGVVFALADETGLLGVRVRLFLAVGILGGFTTFSTFGWGADLLIADGRTWAWLVYACGSVAGGFASVVGGLVVGRRLVVGLEFGAMHVLHRLDERGMRRAKTPRLDMEAIETEDRAPNL